MPANRYQTDASTSSRMRRVGLKNTAPEKAVRRLLSRAGYRYRLHCSDLPGTPDIVFRKKKKAIFVHGCFWHRHQGCSRCTMPKRNLRLWQQKFAATKRRDERNLKELQAAGWIPLVVWECILKDKENLLVILKNFLDR